VGHKYLTEHTWSNSIQMYAFYLLRAFEEIKKLLQEVWICKNTKRYNYM
jgi:hypothetical protein